MRTVAAILLLVVGVAWPLGWLLWLAGRLNRKPPLTPRLLGFLLALNGVLPISFILTAFGLLLEPLRVSPIFKGVLLIAWAAVVVLAIGSWRVKTVASGGPE